MTLIIYYLSTYMKIFIAVLMLFKFSPSVQLWRCFYPGCIKEQSQVRVIHIHEPVQAAGQLARFPFVPKTVEWTREWLQDGSLGNMDEGVDMQIGDFLNEAIFA